MAFDLRKLAIQSKKAASDLAIKTKSEKNSVLKAMAESLLKSKNKLKAENEKDLMHAKKNGLSDALVDRLTLTDERIEGMAKGVKQIISLEDPVGELLEKWKRPNGMLIQKVRVPIGLVGMIYESRPNVTVDASSLCLKSGNACLLRGGKEALHSNKALVQILQKALKAKGFSPYTISFIDQTDRKYVEELLRLEGIVDVIIPRGGKSLVKTVSEKSLIPVIKHYDGNCHVYVDVKANLKKAMDICINSKTQRPGVCNAAESFLIHEKVAKLFVPQLIEALQSKGVEIRGCPLTKKMVKSIKQAKEQDWFEEYLDLIVAMKIVKNIDQAINHINTYGSKHSDCIVSQDKKAIKSFEQKVESAVVFSNVSTRFNDGFEFGFGAEIGISTDKLHARGPVGLKELTTYKYVVSGNGQIRN